MHSQPRLDVRSPEREILARQGLRLPGVVLNRLRSAGIYSQPTVSIERQHVAKRYVLRGVESGGAIRDLGAYTSFVDEHGETLRWLQRVDSIEVNGVHAIVVAPALIRLEMVRIERTYDLLITRHSLTEVANANRPRLESSVLFYGRRGCLEMELWGKDGAFRGAVCPVFYTRSGEDVTLPVGFEHSITQMTAAVCCLGCRHCHLLNPKEIPPSEPSDAAVASFCRSESVESMQNTTR
jgi:hypothetical protein